MGRLRFRTKTDSRILWTSGQRRFRRRPNSSRRRCSPPQPIAEAHSLGLLSLVRSSVWSHRQELYPHITAWFDYASAPVIVHFISPQDKGMRRYLDISPTEGQRPFSL